jgi:hypothetical protein
MSQFASKVVCRKLLEVFCPFENWTGDDSQVKYLSLMPDVSLPELESEIGSGNAGLEKVNRFLVNKGMTDCLLPGPISEQDVAAAVYLLILSMWQAPGDRVYRSVNWATPGTTVNKTIDNQKVAYAQNPGLVKQDTLTGKFFGIIHLENRDYVIFEDISSTSMSPVQIENVGVRLAKLEPTLDRDYSYTGIEFPHLDLDIKRSIEEIEGLVTTDGKNKIGIVKGQLKLKMNHLGAKLEIAMAAVMESTSIRMPKYLTFEQHLNVHFVREGEVYASIQATEESFKEVVIDFEQQTKANHGSSYDDEYLVNPNLEQRYVA